MKKDLKQRYSPSVDMLDSTIEDLMKDLTSDMVSQGPKVELDEMVKKQEHEVNPSVKVVKQEEPEVGSNLVVCGIIPTSSGKISVVRPKNMVTKAGPIIAGFAKLQKLLPRLLKGKINLATVIGATRLPPTIVINWIQTLHLSLPPE